MKYCSHCGKEVLDDAVICPNCGCSVDAAPKQQSAPAPQQESYTTMSIVGFVFALLGGILGLILSIVAYREAKNIGNQKSQTLSKVGIILAAIELGIAVLGFIIGLALLGSAAGAMM